MEVLLSDDEIINEIKEFPNPNNIWINIWEWSENELRIVVSVSDEEMVRMDNHKVIYACKMQGYFEEMPEFKKYGQRITRMLWRKFPNIEVHSELRYRW